MDGAGAKVATDPQRTIGQVGRMHLGKLIAKGRKKSHTDSVESHLRVHLEPFFGSTPINRIEDSDVERLIAQLATKKGLAPKTIRNVLGTLHSVFDFAQRKHWISENPCRLVDGPQAPDTDRDIRYLTLEELDAVPLAITGRHPDAKRTWQAGSCRAPMPRPGGQGHRARRAARAGPLGR